MSIFARYVAGKHAGTVAERSHDCVACGRQFTQNVISKAWRERNPDYRAACEVVQHAKGEVWWFPKRCAHCERKSLSVARA